MAERNNDLKYLNDIQPIDMSSEDLMNLMGLSNDIIKQQRNDKINLDITNDSCKMNTSTTFIEKEINHVSYPTKKSSST